MEKAFKEVCRDPGCVDLMSKTCNKMLPCGHVCCGFKDEQSCLPCLDSACVKKNEKLTNGCSGGDYCTICQVEGLESGPCVQLSCSHIFHLACISTKVRNKWPGPRIVFGYLDCPACKKRIKAPHCPVLNQELIEAEKIEEDVLKKSAERAKHEGLDKDPRLKDPADRFYNNLKDFSIFKLAYFQCFKCKSPYFGGMKDCMAAANENQGDFKPEDLVCGKCSAVSVGAGIQNCEKHG